MSKRVLKEIEDSYAMMEKLTGLGGVISETAAEFVRVLQGGGSIYTFGNGGSAADAQHIAAELVGKFQRVRKPYSAQALSTNSSVLTAIANDTSFDEVFSRQVQAMVRPNDLVLGISTSGRSKNVINGMKAAREKGAFTVALTGGDGGRLARATELAIVVPSTNTQRIQEAHLLICHIICGIVEDELCKNEK